MPRTIAGRVRDGAGNPVPHALLRTRDDVGDVSAERTDSAGRFSLTTMVGMFTARGLRLVCRLGS
ncbi:MAG TPA: carboxypeptidase-like regulatory domain-containing protein, partial [Longimicrobium sp.]|nr:carboxypeptidase-like regulatory domain-containing protein [Longimicrobium sp.]